MNNSKSKKKIRIKENDKEKNNNINNNYDLAINYYSKNIKDNKENIIYLIK